MKSERLQSICSLALLVASANVGWAQRPADSAEVRAFVANFYAWYVPIAFSDTLQVPAETVALRDRPEVFSQEFRSLLAAELTAQRQPGADLGLDFDPILISQDPCERYDVGSVKFLKKVFLVELIPICGGQRSPYQDGVIAEVVQKNGRWLFANFHGPKDKRDVRKVLEGWRDARAKVRRPPRTA